MMDLPIAPTPVYSFRLPRVGYWQLLAVSLCPPAMDGKTGLPPALSHTRFLEHYSTHSHAIPVFTDGSKSNAGVGFSVVFPSFYWTGTLNPTVVTAWCHLRCGTCLFSALV
ncbi:hypothetical protein E2C01_051434 [Portunus trituberculatus]|uniref:Uncharacterized protein n=1 Tax=Portunus trituberculatus TaxID=210409 RepID=A0A5B7GLS5_PORTR|nr:hypothetical protein [Portunus trituberculatus]